MQGASLTKITPPKLSAVYHRERLFKLLDEARNRPVVWICGLPGAGKTTLVASYLQARQLQTLWYRLDEDDADPATLFYYLGLAAKQAAPRKKKPLPFFTPEYMKGLPAFTRRYFRDLYSRLSPPYVVVYDNYQDVSTASRFHEVMHYALEEIPSQGNVIVMSRAEVPDQLARLRANNVLQFIGPDTMRLTAEESQGLIASRNVSLLSEDHVKQLTAQTHGWAAGLTLLCEFGEGPSAPPEIHYCRQLQTVFDYFAGEILRRTDSETEDILLTTALLPTFTAPLAESLPGRPHATQILERLCRNNYFTLCHSQIKPSYEYHPLFREFLLARGKLAYTPARLKELKTKAASLLTAAGDLEEAAKLYGDAENWRGLKEVILHSAEEMLRQGRGQTLKDWIEKLPPKIVASSSKLLSHLGTCYLPIDARKAKALFANALEVARKEQDPTQVFMAWSRIGQAVRYDPSFDHRPLGAWIAMFDEIKREYPVFPSPEIEAVVTARILYAMALHLPHHPQITSWETRAASLLPRASDHAIRLELGLNLAMYHMFIGDHARAEGEVQLVKELNRQEEYVIPTRPKLLQAWYYWETGSYEDCIKTVSSALELACTCGVHLMDFHLLFHGLTAALSAGDLKVADEFIERLTPEFEGPNHWARAYRYLISWSAFLHGDKSSALAHAEAAVDASLQAGLPYIECCCRYGMALVLHDLGQRKPAVAQLARAFEIAHDMRSTTQEWTCLLFAAQFQFDAGDRASALDSLKRAMIIGRQHGYVNCWWWLPQMMTGLCKEALKADIETEYVRDLIRRRALYPRTPPLDIANWPWSVKLISLGRFEIRINDKPVVFSRKAPKKVIALLKAIIAYGGRDVPESQLTDALWVHEEADAAHEAFAVSLHRLRKLIGDDVVILQEGRVTLDARRCWLDTWAFEHVLNQAAATPNVSERVALTEKALTLYHGSFLASDPEEPWALSARERLRAKFIRNTAFVGRYMTDADKWQEALEYYLRGIEVDNLAEEFYQGAMRCYAHLNRRAEGFAIYRRLQRTLSIILGIAPSPASQALYNSLHTEESLHSNRFR